MVRAGRLILGLAVVLMGCQSATSQESGLTTEIAVVSEGYVDTRFLIEPSQLHRSLANGNSVVIVDVRKPEEFALGHLPGARSIWRPDIQDSEGYPYGGMSISRSHTEALLSGLGVTPMDKVVLYDDKGDVDAARFWWILCKYGHHNVALLHGGLTSWQAEGYALEQQEYVFSPTQYVFCDGQAAFHLVASQADVEAAMNDPDFIILDTRTSDEYSGATLKKGAFKPGRIPGSLHIDYYDNLDTTPTGNMRFKSFEELKEMYAVAGVTPDKKIIAYCHSGVRSAHTTFVLTQLLGYPYVANYDGSWTEWSYFNELPYETDSTNISL